MIFVNFKTYQKGTGEEAVELAKICQSVAKKTKVLVIPVVQAVDLFRLASQGVEAWTQHVDDIDCGPNTGQTLPQGVVAAGAQGTLLNHSENKLPAEVVKAIVKKCQGLKLKTLVCVDHLEEAKMSEEKKICPFLLGARLPHYSSTGPTIGSCIKEQCMAWGVTKYSFSSSPAIKPNPFI